ncbi:MAG: hypothetical protein SPL42_10175 [Bacteroidales bacterium]|nr:hypothetical protein [Bacteroidales bacterium]
MKKMTLFITLVFTVSYLNAQKNEKRERHNIRYYHEVGINSLICLYGSPGLDIISRNEFIPTKTPWGIGLYELHGIKFNPHLILSAELNLNFIHATANYNYVDGYYTIVDENGNPLLPGMPERKVSPCNINGVNFHFGVNLKYIILKKFKWSPTLELSVLPIGFAAYSTKGYPRQYDYNYNGEVKLFDRSAMLAIYAGANYKVKDRQSLNLSVGYRIPGNALLLKVGYQFR